MNGTTGYASKATTTLGKAATTAFSLSFWIKIAAFDAGGDFIVVSTSDPNFVAPSLRGYYFAISKTGGLVWALANDVFTNNQIGILGNDDTFLIDTWYHVVAVNDGSATEAGLSVYINGAIAATEAKGNVLVGSTLATQYFSIGFVPGAEGFVPVFNGLMSHVMVHNAALTPAQIIELYTNTAIASGQAIYLMLEGSGTTAANVLGTDNLTITTPVWSTTVPFTTRPPRI